MPYSIGGDQENTSRQSVASEDMGFDRMISHAVCVSCGCGKCYWVVGFRLNCIQRKLWFLPNKQIAFTGGEFARLPSDAKKNLWQYLIATSTEDPDKACSCLLGEMMQEGRPFNEEELRHRFRGDRAFP